MIGLVRLAINHAVDKDTLVRTVLDGIEPRADFLFAPRVPYADVGLKPYGFDRAAASRMLDAAGWTLGRDGVRAKDGRRLAVEVDFVGTNAQQRAIAEVLQADLGRVASIAGDRRGGEFDPGPPEGRPLRPHLRRDWGPPYDPASFISSMRTPSHADYQAQVGLPEKPASTRPSRKSSPRRTRLSADGFMPSC